MKIGWPRKKLGDIAEVQSGGTPLVSKKANWGGDIPWYSSGELNDDYTTASERQISSQGLADSNAKLFPKGSLLIGMYDTAALKMSILDRDAAFNQAIAGVKPTAEVDLLFVLRAITNVKPILLSQRRGVRQKNLSLAKIKDIEIGIPPLSEQRRIVGILDEAFEGLATAKANAEQNLQNARALFESHLQAVFTQRGNGWDTHTQLEDLTEPESPITYGVVKPGDEGEITFIRGGDLARGRILTGQLRTITQTVSQQYRRTLLKGGELLISLVGQPGQVAVAPPELAGANIARQVGLIRLQARMNAEFVRYFLQSPVGQISLGARQSGSVQQVINLGELRQVTVPTPSANVQDEVVENLESVTVKTQRLESLYQRKLAALDELKKSLLHRAFSGQL